MRPLALIASTALVGTALIGAPALGAQAAEPDFTVSWDAATAQFRVVANPGIEPFEGAEELIVSGADEIVVVAISEGSHTISAGNRCVSVPGDFAVQVLCTGDMTTDRTRMTIDMSAATVATTTAVIRANDSLDQLGITFIGGSGPDYVQGGVEDDDIDGGTGDDDIFGGRGNDRLTGAGGADSLDGEEGDDSLNGGPGNDYVNGDAGLDTMVGGSGTDELDSEDGVRDTYVDCENAPGKGKIAFDRGLDLPYNCPVVLPPTAPRKLEAAGGKDSLTVSWAPPEFDGNAPELTYELFYRAPGQSTIVAKPIMIRGTESSYTLSDLGNKPGVYHVSMRVKNIAGVSDSTASVPVTVGGAPSPPQSVQSVFEREWVAKVSWAPPADVSNVTYELGLRVMDRKRRLWQGWTTLPDRVSGTSIDIGDDLQLVDGRVYQFRIRTVTNKDATSNWTNSPARFAGNLAPLANATLTGTKSVTAAVTLPGPAWKYNVTPTVLVTQFQWGPYSGETIALVTVDGDRYSASFSGPPEMTTDCWVGMHYRVQGSVTTGRAQAPAACPK